MIDDAKSTLELQAEGRALRQAAQEEDRTRRQATKDMVSSFIKSRPTAQEQVKYRSIIEGWGSPEDKKRVAQELAAFSKQKVDERLAEQPQQPLPATKVANKLDDFERDLQNTRAFINQEILRLENLSQEGLDAVSELEESQYQTLLGTGGITIIPRGRCTEIHCDTLPPHDMSFSYRLSGNALTVRSGSVITATADTTVPQTAITLTGSEEYIYVQITRSTWAASIQHSSTKPADDSTYIRWRLYHFTAVSGTYVYYRDALYWMGDIHLDTPTL